MRGRVLQFDAPAGGSADLDDADLDDATRAAGVLGLAGLVTAAGNMIFHLLVARQGGVVRYGATATLLSFGTVAAAVAAGLQYSIARRGALEHGSSTDMLRRAGRSVVPWVVACIAFSGCAPTIARYLHLSDTAPALAACAFLTAILVSAVPSGVLLGCRRFGTLAALMVAGAVLRIPIGAALDLEQHGVTKALIASTLAIVLTALVGVLVVVRADAGSGDRVEPAGDPALGGAVLEGAIAASLSAPLLVVWLAPLFFAQHFFGPSSASRFGAAHLMATSILLLVAPITMAFYPAIAAATGDRQRAAIGRGLALTAAASTAGAIVFLFTGSWVLDRSYGSAFAVTPYLVGALGASAAIVSVVTYLFWVSRALRRLAFPATVGIGAALLVEDVAGTSMHRAPWMLAAGPGFALTIGFLCSLVVVALSRRGLDSGAHAGSGVPVPRPAFASGSLLGQTAVGIMAHNEEGTIGRCLEVILNERDGDAVVPLVVVIASACTDRTEVIVREFASRDQRVRLLAESSRSGKAGAINWYVAETDLPLLAVVSADVVFAPGALSAMVAAHADPNVGMTGGRVVPTNPRKGFINRLVHAQWDMHHELALIRPKLGEAVVFKRVFMSIDPATLADEVSIEAVVQASGSELRYVPEAQVYNHGPETLRDFVLRRAVCHRGHVHIRESTGYEPASFRANVVTTAAARFVRRSPSNLPILAAAAFLENAARVQGRLSHELTRPLKQGIWQPAGSAKQALAATAAAVAELSGPGLTSAQQAFAATAAAVADLSAGAVVVDLPAAEPLVPTQP
jgi:O-antigen/teichoic acid export membrane protein